MTEALEQSKRKYQHKIKRLEQQMMNVVREESKKKTIEPLNPRSSAEKMSLQRPPILSVKSGIPMPVYHENKSQ